MSAVNNKQPTPPGSRTPVGATGTRTPATAEAGGVPLVHASAPAAGQPAPAEAPLFHSPLGADNLAVPSPSAAAQPPAVLPQLPGALPGETTFVPPPGWDPAIPFANLPGAFNNTNNNNAASLGGRGNDDDSDCSSDGYDFNTGDVVVSERMSARRRKQILERAMHKRHMEGMHVELNVTTQPPRRSAAQIRQMSMMMLEDARDVIAHDLGVPPVKVVREIEGNVYVLPRESVVTVGKPIAVDDDEGNVTLIAPPPTGYGLDKKFDAIERERTKDKSTVQHYRRSIDALKEVRQARLMRQLDLDY